MKTHNASGSVRARDLEEKRRGVTTSTTKIWSIVRTLGLSLLLIPGAVAQPYSITSVPTGKQPMGIGLAITGGGIGGPKAFEYAVIANYGDNSVSFFGPTGLTSGPGVFTLTPSSTTAGIPTPYAVSQCPPDNNEYQTNLVTSPSDNSVRVLGSGATVQTGPQPYAIACAELGGPNGTAVVSNVGDDTLTVFDVASLKVTATIPGVPGARGFHGIAVSFVRPAPNQETVLAWVAGTDANVVTVVDLIHSTVLMQIPVARPTAVLAEGSTIYVASAGAGTITAYDAASLSLVNNQFASVPNPQDFVFSSLLGNFALSGSDSLWKFDLSNPANTGLAASIPGATTLAAPFDFVVNYPTYCCAMVLATSPSTNSVYLIQPSPPAPSQFAIKNSASYDATGTAPGSLASAVPVATGVAQNISANSAPLPTMLGGVTVNVGGSLTFDTPSNMWTYSPTGSLQAPLLYVGPNQVNFQIPPEIGPGSAVPVQLTKPDGSTLLTTLKVTTGSPGIFTLASSGQGQGAVLNQDNSLNGVSQLVPGANPASRGSVIQIFATGAGATNPPLAAGEAAPIGGDPLVLTVAKPVVIIGGVNAPVQFSGMAPGYPGVWQINAQVPPNVTPGNAVQLQVQIGTAQSNTATVTVN